LGVRGFLLGEESPLLVSVPPGVAHGIAVLGDNPAILVDFDSEPYDSAAPDMTPVEPPDEVPQSLEEMRDEYISHRRSWLYRVGFRKADA
jgi:dTDP-4-dehydrorhamnose 3,5-epimerase-like enzyme